MRHDARRWGISLVTFSNSEKLSNFESLLLLYLSIYPIIDGKISFINYESNSKFTKLIKD